MRTIRIMTLISAVLLALALPAAGKGKPAPTNNDVPVSAEFRCPGVDCLATDHISGDLQGPYGNDVSRYYLNTDGGHGALWMRLPSERSISLNLVEQDGLPPCLSTPGGCQKTFVAVDLAGATFNSNPTDEFDNVLPEGFFSIPVGGSAYSRVLVNFSDPSSREINWTLRFNPGDYPGSTSVIIRRPSEDVWEVEATAAHRARLQASTTKGRPVTTDEGLYVMPFKLTVTKKIFARPLPKGSQAMPRRGAQLPSSVTERAASRPISRPVQSSTTVAMRMKVERKPRVTRSVLEARSTRPLT